MPRIKLYLLGSFSITLDEQPLTKFRSDKVRALLTYLVLEAKRPIWRTLLAELFWHGYTSKTARHSLRMALLNLRQLFSDFEDLLIIDRQTVQLKISHPDFWCDILEFDESYHLSEQHSHLSLARCLICRESFQVATSLYEGSFLKGFVIEDSELFERWRLTKQEFYETRYNKLQELLDIPLPPLPDNLPRQTTPFIGREEEVHKLRQKILDSNYPLITLVGEGGIGKTRLALAIAEKAKRNFVDGVWFIALGSIPSPNEADKNFTFRLHDTLASTIGKTLHIPYHNQDSLTTHLFHYLRDKQLLLILDNFEHLVDGAYFIWQLLQKARYIKILITSRQRLNVQSEYVFRVDGLPFPAVDAGETHNLFHQSEIIDQTLNQVKAKSHISEQSEISERPEIYSSIQLFVERADRTSPGFKLQENNQASVIKICQFVEGLPIGIELAAALVEQQSVAEVARSLEIARLDTLTTSMSDLPARHRNIRAVFEYSWQLLSEREAAIFAECSIFQSGFTKDAAISVTQTTHKHLKSLVDHSLLREISINSGVRRYEFHELVKQFVLEKVDPYKKQEIEERHSLYYLNLIADYLLNPIETRSEDLNELQYEVDNVLQAWKSVTQRKRFDLIEINIESMVVFYCWLNLFEEGIHEFEHIEKQIELNIEHVSVKKRILMKLKQKKAFLRAKAQSHKRPVLMNKELIN